MTDRDLARQQYEALNNPLPGPGGFPPTQVRRMLHCNRCGWEWLSALERPSGCPKCKSKHYDKPRTKRLLPKLR